MSPIENYLIQNREYLYKQAMKLAKSKDLVNDMMGELSLIILSDFKYNGNFDYKKMNTYCWGILLNKIRDHHNRKNKIVMEDIENTLDIVSSDLPITPNYKRTFYEWELESSGFSQTDITRLSNIKFNLKNLEPHEMNLYKMYFEDGLSLSKIATKCSLPKSTVWNHWRLLLIKLKEYSNKNGGLMY